MYSEGVYTPIKYPDLYLPHFKDIMCNSFSLFKYFVVNFMRFFTLYFLHLYGVQSISAGLEKIKVHNEHYYYKNVDLFFSIPEPEVNLSIVLCTCPVQ